jgi:hypothetical protein
LNEFEEIKATNVDHWYVEGVLVDVQKKKLKEHARIQSRKLLQSKFQEV